MPLGIYTVDDNDDPMSFREALERLRLMAELEEQRELELDQQIAEWRARAA
jgi:exonuclease VII small subunit